MSGDWRVGDRVQLWLPDKGRRRDQLVTGTVTGVDDGPRPGVRVELDREVNGVTDCYATHRELAPAEG